ncbi:RagB/SusD family nutrient uptake outer membrane protein [Aquimarina sp. MAR_2010_214]|uniref:RagB/SusD family nutrient uptake outer membrane protein n=1 Tax=Aquimarina sp. MAR_2010_214 TaxID=1250026 RepID=UPI000C7038F8|nr:RagB/SusD family nutrient uptake outer membrane protein [Aquimarina sp. MAR_2010_214]
MKNIYKIVGVAVLGFMTLTSCDIDEVGDLNGPTLENIIDNSTKGDIQDLVGGILSDMRVRLGTYYDDVGVIGREYYRFSSSDPRFTSDLLGKDKAVLDNNTFYTTGPWGARYGTAKGASILVQAIENTSPAYSEQEKNGLRGIGKTIQAYELLLNLNLTYQGGIRADISNPESLGPFIGFTQSLDAIEALLVSGATDLSNAGSEFAVNLSSGFTGFNTPATFLQFNKAISARVAAYQGDLSALSGYLTDSFLSLTNSSDDLAKGVYYVFSADGGDLRNPMFFALNASTAGVRVAHPDYITDIGATDSRRSKVAQRSSSITSDGLSGDYDFRLYTTDVDPIPLIRNEELILLYAEANHISNPTNAVTAIDLIRNAAGIGAYVGGTSPAELLNEILTQRRFSLYGEGHRWIDMRRFDRLGDLPIDRVGGGDVEPDDVWVQFPIPATENQ